MPTNVVTDIMANFASVERVIRMKPTTNELYGSRWTNRQILRLAIPAIVSNITVPLLSLSDTAVSGHLGSADALGAIAVGTMMINMAYWLFGFLRMGTTGLAAEAYGKGDRREKIMVVWRALAVAVSAGTLLIILSPALRPLLLMLSGASPDVGVLAGEYYSVCICGAPALLGTMALSGWMIGMQNTVYPMVTAIVSNLVNILLSVIFVFVCDFGFVGVAWGTLVAQWIGFFIAVLLSRRLGARYVLLFRGPEGRPLCREIVKGDGLGKFFRVNTDIFFRSFCIMAVSMTVTSVGARLGTVTLGANAVLMQFFIFFSYFMDGFAFAGEALTGRFKGENNKTMIGRCVRQLLWWSAGVATLFFTIYYFGSTTISGLITDNPDILRRVGEMRWVVLLLPPLSVGAFIFDGFYIGMTMTRRLLGATSLAALMFFAVAFIPTSGHLPGNDLLWTAFLTYLSLRALLLAAPSRRLFSIH